MEPRHHLDIATLMSCSAGSQPEALALIVASHLAVCPQCRSDLEMGSSIGVALFEDIAPAALTCGDPRLSNTDPDGSAQPNAGVPPPGSRHAEDHGAGQAPVPPLTWIAAQRELTWTEPAPGVGVAALPLSLNARGRLHLVRMAPGASLPPRLTDTTELTFVVDGGIGTATRSLKAGDVLEGLVAHQDRLTADLSDGCLCLMGTY